MDVSGSMQSSIRNDKALDISRLEGVEKVVDSLLADSRRIAREWGCDEDNLPLRVFVYAFGLNAGEGCTDALALLHMVSTIRQRAEEQARRAGEQIGKAVAAQDFQTAANTIVQAAEQSARRRGAEFEQILMSPEFESFLTDAKARAEANARAKGERMRATYSSYGGLAAAARSFGFGGLVDSYTSSVAANTERQLRDEAEAEVINDVVAYLEKHLADPPTPEVIRDSARAWENGGKKAAAEALELGLRNEAKTLATQGVVTLLKSRLEESPLSEADLSKLVRAWYEGGDSGACVAVEAALRCHAQEQAIAEVAAALKSGLGDITLTAPELAKLWSNSSLSSVDARGYLFGNTPMKACLNAISARLAREEQRTAASDEQRVLLLISDGEPTDATSLEIETLAAAIRKQGCHIACAYITNDDVQTPRDLRSVEDPQWPAGAKLLFALSSCLDDLDAPNIKAMEQKWGLRKFFVKRRENQANCTGAMLRQALEQGGWTVPSGAKLFLQANHSDILADFTRIALTAVPASELLRRGLKIYGD